jgi:DNA-binding CsgD family transcriptional regulator
LILRVAHFRTAPDSAVACAARVQALFNRVRRVDGLAWSAVGRQADGDAVIVIAVSLWRDRHALEQVLGGHVEGRSEAEAREGLPEATLVELAEVVDTIGLPPGLAPRDPFGMRRRRALLPQDRQLLRLLCSGATLAEAATRLGVSVGTAKNRRHEIYEKLGVHDLNAACAIAGPELSEGDEALAG